MQLWQKIYLTSFAVLMICLALISYLLLNRQRSFQMTSLSRQSMQVQELIWTDLAGRLMRNVGSDPVLVRDEVWDEVLSQMVHDEGYSTQPFEIAMPHLDAPGADAKSELTGDALYHTPYWLRIWDELPWAPGDGVMVSFCTNHDVTDLFVANSRHEVYGRAVFLRTQIPITDWMADYRNLKRQICLIVMGMSLSGGLLLLILTWLSMRPLKCVSMHLHEIADGAYGKQLNLKGHDEIALLAADADQMSEKIAQSIRTISETSDRQKQFIQNMAHEMKTPLTSIMGFADILGMKPDLTEDERHEYAEVIGREAERLAGLSEKLMSLFLIQQGKGEMTEVQLSDCIQDTVDALRPLFKEKELAVTIEAAPVKIIGDRLLLESLCFNLLDNARKACHRGGTIDISLQQDKAEIKLAVKDDGIGMSQETIARITEPFYMADKARSRSEGGAGLGMALSEEIIKLHGGRLVIESQPGKGTFMQVVWKKKEADDIAQAVSK